MGANLTVLADIKDLALKTKTLEIEKRGKSNAPNLTVNPVKENQDVDALYQGQRFRGNSRGGFRGGSVVATEVVSNETKNLAKIPKIEGIPTLLNQDLKTNRQQPLIKEGTMDKTAMEEELTLLASRAEQENGVLIVVKLHTTQLNVGATKRKLSMTSTMKKMNNLKTKKTHLSVTRFIHSSKHKTKNCFLRSTGR
jgi:hypothetical protein